MICNNHWKIIFRVCFRSIPDNNYIWFQYRIIYRILGTNEYLYKLKLTSSNLCRLCSQDSESIEHLFLHCNNVIILWNNIKTCLLSKISYNGEWTNVTKVLCYEKQDEHFWPSNFILIITRHYIFSCSQKRRKLDIFWLQKIIKDKYEEHKILSKITSKMEIYAQRWQTWEGIFNNI